MRGRDGKNNFHTLHPLNVLSCLSFSYPELWAKIILIYPIVQSCLFYNSPSLVLTVYAPATSKFSLIILSASWPASRIHPFNQSTSTPTLFAILLSWIINTNMGPRDATKQSSIFCARAELLSPSSSRGGRVFSDILFDRILFLTVSLGMAVNDPVSP